MISNGASGFARRLPELWYRRQFSLVLLPLLPVSWLFRALVAVRRDFYRCGLLASFRLPVPIIVVGNVTVGGSGKTPLVLWLVERLRQAGHSPAIISRGYGSSRNDARRVTVSSRPDAVGDEPLLLARRSGVPVYVGPDRVATAQRLLEENPGCDVIVSDDGLQHYRMQRDIELVVFDRRAAGNRRLLPAGPLREPLSRLADTTAIIWNGESQRLESGRDSLPPQFEMRLQSMPFHALREPERRCAASDLVGKPLFALAGIGNPQRFFDQLAALGLDCIAHPFPDHHVYRLEDLAFARDGVLLMTEKDAVKCAGLPYLGEAWVLPVEASMVDAEQERTLLQTILEKL